MIPVIIAGGSGTRLWPLSRSSQPKQFLGITEQSSLFQLTIARLDGLTPVAPLIVCNAAHRFVVAEQCRQMQRKPSGIVLESHGRGTAPAIAAAALAAIELGPDGEDPLLLVLPADHVIADIASFQATIRSAVQLAEAGRIVIFGVRPYSANTGYGYIETQSAQAEGSMSVSAFFEKPDLATAQAYVATGRHFWNSGIFLFRASVYLEELAAFAPEISRTVALAIKAGHCEANVLSLDPVAFEQSPSDSIDYAVMEHTTRAVVVPLVAGWSDLGAWDAVWDMAGKDSLGNVVRGDAILQDVHDSHVVAEQRLVALIGLDEVIVVDTPDALLVAHKSRVQDVKALVDQLKLSARPEAALHRKVQRPWGSYDSIGRGPRYQVKCIAVQPGQKLSRQMHHHRAEHWIVVSGTARVWVGDRDFLVTEDQSAYIPVGVLHALENPGKILLEVIEVQAGSYLEEDDIVRLSDIYGRVANEPPGAPA